MAQPRASVQPMGPAIASYSVPMASWCEGAQRSATPCVPDAHPMIGRGEDWNQGSHGTITFPVTAMALPLTSVDLYMICQPQAGSPSGT
ncbi:hypothetical protein D3C87_1475080 [compost metagenome]